MELSGIETKSDAASSKQLGKLPELATGSLT